MSGRRANLRLPYLGTAGIKQLLWLLLNLFPISTFEYLSLINIVFCLKENGNLYGQSPRHLDSVTCTYLESKFLVVQNGLCSFKFTLGAVCVSNSCVTMDSCI